MHLKLHCRKKSRTIKYGCRKWGTHARVFSHTLAQGNRKNEIRRRKTEEGKKFEMRDMERRKAGMKEKELQTPTKTQ